MGKQKIEDNDQELIQKFRSVIHLKEQQHRKARKRMVASGLVASCLFLVFLFGYALNKDLPENPGASGKETRMPSEKAVRNPEPDPALPSGLPPNSSGQSAGPAAGDDRNAQAIAAPSASTESGSEQIQPDMGAPRGVADEPPLQSIEGIRIAEIVACRQVIQRIYLAPQSVFSIEEDHQPDVWVWMDVRSEIRRLPYTLTHVYYLNGREYATVPLEVKYPRMRTWSNLTLEGPDQVGRWCVAVVAEGGEVLSRIEFEVVP